MLSMIYLVFTAAILFTIGDIFIKEWIINNTYINYIYGILIYVFAMQFSLHAMKFKSIQIISISGILLNTILYTLYSYYRYNDILTNSQIVGIILSFISIMIMWK